MATLSDAERELCIDNLLVRIHCIIVMIRWTGLAPREFEFPFPGSLTSTFLVGVQGMAALSDADLIQSRFLQRGRYKATWKREFRLPWREAGPPNHHDDKVDSDQAIAALSDADMFQSRFLQRGVLGPYARSVATRGTTKCAAVPRRARI